MKIFLSYLIRYCTYLIYIIRTPRIEFSIEKIIIDTNTNCTYLNILTLLISEYGLILTYLSPVFKIQTTAEVVNDVGSKRHQHSNLLETVVIQKSLPSFLSSFPTSAQDVRQNFYFSR